MFQKIMVPVDLEHQDNLKKAQDVAAGLSKYYKSPVCYVGVTTEAPSALAHSPEEYRGKLETFCAAESERLGHPIEAHAYMSHDPSVELNQTLLDAIAGTGSDLVVMASHVPGFAALLQPSHGGNIAAHAKVSVFVVR